MSLQLVHVDLLAGLGSPDVIRHQTKGGIVTKIEIKKLRRHLKRGSKVSVHLSKSLHRGVRNFRTTRDLNEAREANIRPIVFPS